MNILKEHQLTLGILFLVCALAAWGKLALIGTTPSGDYTAYLRSAEHLAGQTALAHPERLLKPLAPLATALLAPFLGFPTAFLVTVVFGYFAFVALLYALGYAFFGKRRDALYVALLGALSYPMLRYGLDLYTEGGAMAFYCLSLLLTLWYLKSPSMRLVVLNAFVIGIGFLWKEYSVVNGIIFGLVLLFESVATREKAQRIAVLVVLALLPTILVQLWIYFGYHYTYIDWWLTGGENGFNRLTLFNIVKSLFTILGLAWFFVPAGFMRLNELAASQKRLLTFALIPPFIALGWGFVSSRLLFPIAPAFLLLAVLGIGALPKWWRMGAVLAILLADIAWLLLVA